MKHCQSLDSCHARAVMFCRRWVGVAVFCREIQINGIWHLIRGTLFVIQRVSMEKILRCLILGLFIYGSSCWAVTLDETRELVIPVDRYTPKITSADVAKVIPLDIHPEEGASRVVNRIADRGFGLWFDTVLKDSSIGRMAEAAQETLKTDIEVVPTEPGGVAHKVTMQFEAFAAQAIIKYSGWVKAQIRVSPAGSDIVVKEKIFENKDLLLSHSSNRDQDISMISMGWSW